MRPRLLLSLRVVFDGSDCVSTDRISPVMRTRMQFGEPLIKIIQPKYPVLADSFRAYSDKYGDTSLVTRGRSKVRKEMDVPNPADAGTNFLSY